MELQYRVNKKSELMLMRRVRAYHTFCSQVVLIYLHPFFSQFTVFTVLQLKITKKH